MLKRENKKLNGQIEDLKDENKKLYQQLDGLKNENNKLCRQKDCLNGQINNLKGENANLIDKVEVLYNNWQNQNSFMKNTKSSNQTVNDEAVRNKEKKMMKNIRVKV